MEIFIAWLIFAIVVAIAAEARGRNPFGWFLLSVVLSPLVGLILVLVLPNLRYERLMGLAAASDAVLETSPGARASRIDSRAFEPDGVLAGFPYRVAEDGSIEAIMQGAIVRFRDFEKFTSSVGS